MTYNLVRKTIVAIALTSGSMASAAEFIVELSKPLTGTDTALRQSLNVSEVERFDATGKSYVVFDVKDEAVLMAYFFAKSINPLKIKEVDFVNSPEIGGGVKAGSNPKPGHQVFVIERPIPGVGDLPLAIKEEISMGSNAVIAKMGDVIEWDHSFLTDEGTYCVYRAVNSDIIKEHSELAGAPIQVITPVVHTKATSE